MKSRVFNSVFVLIVFLATSCSKGESVQQLAPDTVLTESTATQIVVQGAQTLTETPTSEPVDMPLAEQGSPLIDLGYTPINFEIKPVAYTLPASPVTAPVDVLKEVSFSGGMGGWGDDDPCAQYASTRSGVFFLEEKINELEWKKPTYYLSCGWTPKEEINYTVTDPTGEVFQLDPLVANANGSVGNSFNPDLNSLPGEYLLTLQGISGVLTQKIYVEIPTVPRIYYDKDRFILYNFYPNEHVRFVAYKREEFSSKGLLWDVQKYLTNSDGQLIIQLAKYYSIEDVAFGFLGEKSGEVKLFPYGWNLQENSLIYPFSIYVAYPSDQEVGSVKSIWEGIAFRDLMNPGHNTYTVTLLPTDIVTWGFNWCAIDKQTLNNSMIPLYTTFVIDGYQVEHTSIRLESRTLSNGWQCKKWLILLSGWEAGSSHVLEVNYSLDKSIYDGAATYPAGEYQQIINVNVK